MAKFVYVYAGGRRAETPDAQEQQMQAWTTWLAGLGEAVTDVGNPFGASASVKAGGSSAGAVTGLGGYTIIDAESLDAATAKADGCPILGSGGSVEVYEALAM